MAARQSILSTHFNFLKKKSKKGSRTALAEYDVNKNTAGKKGARNKNSYRPETYCSSGVEPSNQARQTFTEIHHNENQFVLMFLPQEARTCKSYEIEFCQTQLLMAIGRKRKRQRRRQIAYIILQRNASLRDCPISIGIMLKFRPTSLILWVNRTGNISWASFKTLSYNSNSQNIFCEWP